MTKISILIVEDEAIVAKWIQKHLISVGYPVVGSVATGIEALELAGQNHPDIILLDIRLKGTMDGIEVAHTIRNRFRIPVIFMTAFADVTTIERANETDPYGYLIKPFDKKSLFSAIESAWGRIELEKTGAYVSSSDGSY